MEAEYRIEICARTEAPRVAELLHATGITLDIERELALAQARCLIATGFEATPLLGFALVWLVGDDLELIQMAVRPETRRRGIGRTLLNAVIELGRTSGLSAVFLEVRASNLPALELYRDLGFVALGERPNYYHSPVENAILMRLPLFRC